MNAMLKKLNSKRNGKKGFTLMEMLIVVAIIAVLVAIAIPTFNGALDKAKYSADLANVRAWYAETQIELMTNKDAKVPTAYDGNPKLQATNPVVTVTGNTAATFSVTYKSDYNKVGVTFGAKTTP